MSGMNYIRYQLGNRDIFIVDMKLEQSFPFSELAEKTMAKLLPAGKRITLITSRKGFAGGMICKACGHIPHCTHCDIPVAYHKTLQGQMIGLCHICKRQYSADPICGVCGGYEVDLYGIGTQQLASLVKERFGITTLNVESERANSPKKVQQLMHDIAGTQVLIGTSLLSQPTPTFRSDAIIFLNVDSGLGSPDYTSNRNQYAFLQEVFTKNNHCPIILQTRNPEHPTLIAACTQNDAGYRMQELAYRKQLNYPPYTEMCSLLYKHEIETRLFTHVNTLYQELLYLKERYQQTDLEIYSTPPLVYKMFGKYRYHIILKGSHLRQFMDIARSKLNIAQKGFKMDWEPKNIL